MSHPLHSVHVGRTGSDAVSVAESTEQCCSVCKSSMFSLKPAFVCQQCDFVVCLACDKGHEHPAHDQHKLYFINQEGPWRCDVCKKSSVDLRETNRFYCPICDFNMCNNCFPSVSRPPRAHRFIRTDVRNVYHESSGEWFCNVCKDNNGPGNYHPWHCKTCPYDICDNCWEPWYSSLHPGHEMFKTDSKIIYFRIDPGWFCNECKRKFRADDINQPFHCMECKFDLCNDCMRNNGSQSNKGPCSSGSPTAVNESGEFPTLSNDVTSQRRPVHQSTDQSKSTDVSPVPSGPCSSGSPTAVNESGEFPTLSNDVTSQGRPVHQSTDQPKSTDVSPVPSGHRSGGSPTSVNESGEFSAISNDATSQGRPVHQSTDQPKSTDVSPVPSEYDRQVKVAAQNAIKHGKKRNNRISVFLIGQDGVGKTSLKKRLLGQPLNEDYASTIGIQVDIVDVEEKDKEKPWQSIPSQQRLASEEYLGDAISKNVAEKLEEMNKIKQQVTATAQQLHQCSESDDNDGDDPEIELQYEQPLRKKHRSSDSLTDESGSASKLPVESDESDIDFTPKQLEYIKRKMANADQHDDDAMTKVRLLLQDVAGQSLFYDIHSIFLSHQSLFILVVALDKDLHAKAQPLFVNSEKGICLELENYLVETNLDYANRWMAALHNISFLNEGVLGNEFIPPPTILVLTKPDTVQGSETEKKQNIRKVKEILLNSFTDNECGKHIVGIFVINNKCDDSQLLSLRKTIFEKAQVILKAQDKIPINWLKLERGLSAVLENERKRYITYDQLEQLAEEAGARERLTAAVQTLSDQKVIIHFHDDEKARNLVVLDPQWLVNLFSSIITVPTNREQTPKSRGLWKRLADHGELSEALIDEVLVEYDRLQREKNKREKDVSQHKESLIRMMEMVSLICRWDDETWIVPSMVKPEKTRDEVEDLLTRRCTPSLYMMFEGGYVPLGLFVHLLVILLGKYKHFFGNDMPKLSCHFSHFPVDDGEMKYYIILIQHISKIQIVLSSKDPSIPNDKLRKFASTLKSSICETVEELRRISPIYQIMKYHFALMCDKCAPKEPEKCSRYLLKDRVDENCVSFAMLEKCEMGHSCCRCNARINDEEVNPWIDLNGRARQSEFTIEDSGPNTSGASSQGAVRVRNSYGVPPSTNVITPSLKDLNPEFKSWESELEQLTDVLLLVVDDEELLSCYAFLYDVSKSYNVDLGHVYFGKIGNDAKVKVAIVRCAHDSDLASCSTNVVRNAARLLRPKVVFSVGCCAGLQRERTQLGDVVISRNLLTCGVTKIVGDKQQWKTHKLDVPRNVGRLIMSAADGWQAPLNDTDVREVKVHCDGVILSGVKLKNSLEECKELIRQNPEAIAIEQEGQGVYSAASDLKAEWVIVKGISHYADGGEPETKEWRYFSSVMAASVVSHILKDSDVLKDWPHYQEEKSSQTC